MKSDYIQIKNKFYQECDIVMLATEKAQKNSLCLTAGSKLILLDGKDWETVNDVAGFRPQHLYILSSEEIKEGDWCLIDNNVGQSKGYQLLQCEKTDINNGWYYFKDFKTGRCKKIIATTDRSLKIERNFTNQQGYFEYLPRPSDDFIKAFIEKQGKIDKVLVEYVDWCDYDDDNEIGLDKPDLRLKVAPDNTITIKPLQEQWQRDMLKTLQEPKQETLEEVAKRLVPNRTLKSPFGTPYEITPNRERNTFIKGVKWQKERSYSEEDMIKFAEFVATYPDKNRNHKKEMLHAKSKYDGAERTIDLFQIWFKQFKNK